MECMYFLHLLIFLQGFSKLNKQMEKWMVVYLLPLEVWMDIFCFPWISRRKFGQIVEKIGNFKFAEHAQFYLHEWGKHKLGKLYFDQNGPYKCVNRKPYRLKYPQTPMPVNIKSFDWIRIRYFDLRTFAFLGQIRPLLTNVHLGLYFMRESSTILTNLVPFLDGIHTLRCDDSTFTWMELHFPDKWMKLKVLEITPFPTVPRISQENFNTIMEWINQADEESENGPRLCEFRLYDNHGIFEQVLQRIRQDFLTAKTPSTFGLNVGLRCWNGPVVELRLENGVGEQLHGEWKPKNSNRGVFRITRHRTNFNTQLQEWISANTKRSNRGYIHICDPSVGPLDTAQMDGGQHDQQPSTSKEA